MPSLCIFELFKQPEVYFVGETIEGTITLITTNDKQITDMVALLRGEGKVRYQENYEGDKTCKLVERTVYRGKENYLFKIIRLEFPRLLPAGCYKYNIRFALNEFCLTSCETERGYIRYEICLIIKRVKGYNNVFKHGVTVINHVNLNISPSLKQPIQSKSNNKACCHISKKRFCTLSTTVAVYAPGQVLKYTLAIHNTPKKKIGGCIVRLLKKMSFISMSPVSKVCTTRNYIVNKFVPARHRVKDAFLIPSTPPTTLSSKIIHIEYMLEVKVRVHCCWHSDLSAEIPIVIVAVPIKESLLYSQVSTNNKQVKNLTPSAEQAAYQPSIFDCKENSSMNTRKRPAEVGEEDAAFNRRRARLEEESSVFSTPVMDCDKQPAAPQTGDAFFQLLNNKMHKFSAIKERAMARSAIHEALYPLIGFEEQPTRIREAMKHKISAALNSPYQSYEEQPMTSRQAKQNGRAAALNFASMSYDEEKSTSLPGTSPPNNIPFMDYKEQPSMSHGANNEKPAAAAYLTFMDYEDQPLTSLSGAAGLNLPQMDYEEQPSTSAFNSGFRSYEKPPSKFCASRMDEKLVADNLPIEITMRESTTAILPPNDVDMKPTSFELEPCFEPPLEDDDVPEYDRLVDFRPLYPVYRSKSQPKSIHQNLKAKEQISVDGYLRLMPEFGLPPSENLIQST